MLDLCSSALKANDILSPFLENILKKKAVYYQDRLRIMLDWFGFVPYTDEKHIHSLAKKPPWTPLRKAEGCFGGFFFFLLVLM